jgi:hypothetical protein
VTDSRDTLHLNSLLTGIFCVQDRKQQHIQLPSQYDSFLTSDTEDEEEDEDDAHKALHVTMEREA